ncbi:MAG: hypothetical protein KA419_13115 [Acidobacteria bacterium]|nr:hypothetical protein [Acidobacteriota bacterium]
MIRKPIRLISHRLAWTIVTAVLSIGTVPAGSTRVLKSWKSPLAGQVQLAGKKVAVFVVSADESMRQGPEETLATELRSRGVDGVAGYTVLPVELTRNTENAKAFLKRVGITYAIMVRLAGKEEEINYVPGTTWYARPYYPSFWGYWNYSWAVVGTPGYVYSQTVVSLETLVYSIEEDKLLWAGASRTTDQGDIRKEVKKLVAAVGKQIRKDGLLPE